MFKRKKTFCLRVPLCQNSDEQMKADLYADKVIDYLRARNPKNDYVKIFIEGRDFELERID